MADAESQPVMEQADVAAEAAAESMFSTLDLIVLALLGLAAVYYVILRNKRKEEELAQMQSFTITSSAMPMSVSDDSFIDKMKSSGKNVLVVYGSQTGTAEEFSTRISKECRRYGMRGLVADPEECSMQDLPRLTELDTHLAIFVLATYGEGDPSDNAQEFHEWLKETDVDLSGINYTVFGLGNKTYEHYNAMGKFVDRRMEELGATRVFELGLGDDDANIEEDFLGWKERMFPHVKEYLGIEDSGEEEKRQYELKVLEDANHNDIFSGEVARLRSYTKQRPPFDAKNPYLAPLRVNRRLQKGGDRELMHLELDIEGSRIRYEAGDHVAVYPTNDLALVDKLGEIFNVNLDTIISLNAIDPDTAKKHPFPCPTTYRTALLHYLDITSVPKHYVLKELAEYATDEKEKERLLLMAASSEEGKAAYHQWMLDPCRTLLHLLEDMPSCRPPLDLLCELLNRLQPRYYSISSSSKVHPTRIHITCVQVKYQTSTGRTNRGVATTWLLGHKTSDRVPAEGEPPLPMDVRVPCFVRKSQFRLPSRSTTPVIMIGPGTGFAPMRGFIQERAFQKEQGKEVGETWMFYGCRHKEEDYMYREELEKYEADGVIKLSVAFSRDQAQKVYVTHHLKEHAADVWRLLGQQNGHVYVCGDAKSMARDVSHLLTDICRDQGGMDAQQADQYIKTMRSQKRYSEDVWS
ncbi:NADPH--cytochrome P450 reductase-like isoform X1 [Amphibalanus amphitrite]|uniref:NADPH--cytochrome P450 reductase-like isoform X1 n=1 Tax=Amphibalanus amphitrite TaxID=1232801 RepID=UPI001C916A97|nr:NADPH--cytochrome P450 reductase-like isoform X1 [Amphibalanus amphitrite]XP_043191360.1 NADPH--cytochrome P450 reductase-like isoform X1 [Amphibalanus amphitrite]